MSVKHNFCVISLSPCTFLHFACTAFSGGNFVTEKGVILMLNS